jgi:hypothetical protein
MEHSENVDELGYDRDTGTAGADRVDEINARAGEHGQGAGGGPYASGTAGEDEGPPRRPPEEGPGVPPDRENADPDT